MNNLENLECISFNDLRETQVVQNKLQAQAANVYGNMVPYPYSGLTGCADRPFITGNEATRLARVTRSLEILREAAAVRADKTLMEEIRVFVRQERDRLGLVLDGLGDE